MDKQIDSNKELIKIGSFSSINWEKVIIAVIVLFLFGCLAFYTGNKFPTIINSSSNKNITLTSNINKSPTPIPTIDTYSGWKQYTDPLGYFTFQYPQNWSIKMIQGTSIDLQTPGGYIFHFAFLPNPIGLGGGPSYYTQYRKVTVEGTDLVKAYINSCDENNWNDSNNACTKSVTSIKYDTYNSKDDIPINQAGILHQIDGDGYPKINGVTSILGLIMDHSVLLTDPTFQSIDKQLDLVVTSLKFPETTVTNTPSPTYMITDYEGTSTFTGFGISFTYEDQEYPSNIKTGIKVIGNRVYLGDATDPQNSGLYIDIFSISPTNSIQTAITKTILSGYNPSDCPITVSTQPMSGYPSTFQTAVLNYASNNQTVSGVGGLDPSKCPMIILLMIVLNTF